MEASQNQERSGQFSWQSGTSDRAPAASKDAPSDAPSLDTPLIVPVPRPERGTEVVGIERRISVQPEKTVVRSTAQETARGETAEDEGFFRPGGFWKLKLFTAGLNSLLVVMNVMTAATRFSTGDSNGAWVSVGLAALWGTCALLNFTLAKRDWDLKR